MGVPEAYFRACMQYIHTCKLPSSISSFRSKSMMYGALASRFCSSQEYNCGLISSLPQQHKSEAKLKESKLNEVKLECD